MATESLEKRRLKLAGLRDQNGNPIDERKLTHEKFLSSPNADSAAVLHKSRAEKEVDQSEALRKHHGNLVALVRDALPDIAKLAKTSSGRELRQAYTELEKELKQIEKRLGS